MNRFPRWPVVGLGLVFVGLLAWGIWFYRVHEKRLRHEAETALETIAQLKAGQIAAWRAERLGDAAVIAESPFFIQAVAGWMVQPSPCPGTHSLAVKTARLHMHVSSHRRCRELSHNGERKVGCNPARIARINCDICRNGKCRTEARMNCLQTRRCAVAEWPAGGLALSHHALRPAGTDRRELPSLGAVVLHSGSMPSVMNSAGSLQEPVTTREFSPCCCSAAQRAEKAQDSRTSMCASFRARGH